MKRRASVDDALRHGDQPSPLFSHSLLLLPLLPPSFHHLFCPTGRVLCLGQSPHFSSISDPISCSFYSSSPLIERAASVLHNQAFLTWSSRVTLPIRLPARRRPSSTQNPIFFLRPSLVCESFAIPPSNHLIACYPESTFPVNKPYPIRNTPASTSPKSRLANSASSDRLAAVSLAS